MKMNRNILQTLVLGSAVSGLSAHAALLGITPPTGSPLFSDFTSSGLNVSYAYSGTGSSGSGVFTASSLTTPSTGNGFTANGSAPGTGAFSQSGFSGHYSLTATIDNNNGVYTVTGGSVSIYGLLAGYTSSSSDLLLSANLKTGSGTIGYLDGTGTKGTTEFDFLFTTAGGNSAIVQDFLGIGFGQGGVVLTTGSLNTAYNGLNASFANNFGQGQASTFIPEPTAYPMAAASVALLAFTRGAFFRRKLA